MNFTRPSLLVLIVALGASTWGCKQPATLTASGPKGSGVEAGLAIRELVVRQLLALPRDGMEVYVSFGSSWADKVDPPAAFFERLRDAEAAVRPVSELTDDTKNNVVLLVLSQPFWGSEVEAMVSAVRFRFGAGGADGFSARAVWDDGKWALVENVKQWGT